MYQSVVSFVLFLFWFGFSVNSVIAVQNDSWMTHTGRDCSKCKCPERRQTCVSKNQGGCSPEDREEMMLEGRSGAKSHSALLSMVEDLFFILRE